MLKQCLPLQTRRMAFLWVTSFYTLLAPLVSTAAANEPIWPQWRGPQRDDISQETGLLSTWPEAGPRQVWLSKNCGLGYSGPAIVGNRLYILGARDDREQLLALDMATGEAVWSTEVGEVLQNDWGNGPRGTPTVDVGQQGKTTDATHDPFVYALGGQGNLVCVRASDGKLVWKQSLLELGGELPKWGYTESPLIYQHQVLCTPGGEQGAIAALDKRTGEVLWQSQELTETAHYASMILARHNGKMQCIQLLSNHVTGLDADTGQVRWKVDWPGRVAVIPTPIYHQNHVYVSSGYGVGGMLLRLGEDDPEESSGTAVEEVYRDKVIKNHHGGVILVDGHLYGHSDKAGWICQNFLSGEVLWRERKALGKGAIAYADGRFYCLGEQDGAVVLIGASPAGWQEHGRFTLDPQTTQRSDRGKIWTHPVICNGKLLLRDQELLFCFDVKEE
jgi:hypothetical protein